MSGRNKGKCMEKKNPGKVLTPMREERASSTAHTTFTHLDLCTVQMLSGSEEHTCVSITTKFFFFLVSHLDVRIQLV